MAIDITSADRGMIRSVIENMREVDRVEMLACDTNLDRLPDHIMRNKVFAFCAFDYDTGPIAIWGMVQRRPGVGAGFAFGTDAWCQALRPMVRQIRNFVVPFLVQAGFHRVEAAALAYRDDVARLMMLIGAEREALLRGYGTAGEDFVCYRWLDEHCCTHQQRQEDRHATH
jgi:hypothetical protein